MGGGGVRLAYSEVSRGKSCPKLLQPDASLL